MIVAAADKIEKIVKLFYLNSENQSFEFSHIKKMKFKNFFMFNLFKGQLASIHLDR